MPDTPSVVIVGAGLAGLAAARDLTRAGRPVTVVEARDRVGGRIVNHRFDDDLEVEIGGQWVGPTQDRILALASALGVETFPTYDTGDLVTARDGKIVRHRSPTFGLPGAAVVEIAASQPLLDRLAARVDLDEPWATRGAERLDSTTFETWIRRHHATAAARGFWRLAIEAVFAAEPRDISLLHVAFYLHSGGSLERLLGTRRGAQQDRFVGGSAVVADRALAELRDQGVEVRLGAPVRAVEQGEEGVVVRHDGGEVRADRAIVAVPPALAGRIAWSPLLPARRDQLLQKMPMGSVIKCLVRYDRPFWREDGLCGQAAALDSAVTITFDNSPPDDDGPGVLVAFLEGDHARRASEMSARARRAEVVDALTRFFGPQAQRPTDYAERDWAAEEWTRGCYGAHLAPGVWTSFGDLLRAPWGRVHWAGTETAAVWNGYMDGAVRSGERAATEVLAAS
ncbi:flavin monoamine oxidase family protein [Iamia sp. SCSIO 61187]|uniref:flavin monoamine oxidase family protein n=1 Tax=Iamia sp. SCSIO 61187 TaxID=2722752 RepID=UPI001C62619D|nr:flavin monoamine oxidase family protein [Iamia sp. SCSIO 61187]QYG94083.1 flavin monoamine oxidase family protein [Iamia sp. SCSIO 61187]